MNTHAHEFKIERLSKKKMACPVRSTHAEAKTSMTELKRTLGAELLERGLALFNGLLAREHATRIGVLVEVLDTALHDMKKGTIISHDVLLQETQCTHDAKTHVQTQRIADA
jgi:hypothetical protein